MADFFSGYEFALEAVHDGRRGLARALEGGFDLIILDVMLPVLDGFEVLAQIRRRSSVPVIMLTARIEQLDRIAGLDAGADDYLPKPFEPRELLARLNALLRRANRPTKPSVLRFGRLEIDRDARSVRVEGVERSMTSFQFDLLVALAESAGRVLSREALMDLMKGEKLEAFDRSIDVHVSRIRAAIEDDAKTPRRIITVRGAGYVFAKQQN